jgi:imidazole glycerol-phosphate synthase subunit HisH
MIVIIDYGVGNIGSIMSMLKRTGAEVVVSSDISTIRNAKKLILPGVGSFDNGMKNLEDMGLLLVLNEKVIKEKIPILGICLGMQLFTERSEEGGRSGLGWIKAETIKFKLCEFDESLKIPHMGWNTIQIQRKNQIFGDMDQGWRFYFAHSYHVVCKKYENMITSTHYGYDFASSIMASNIIGVQFHPEKSHKFGMKLLENFARYY